MKLPSFLKTGNRVFVEGVEMFDVTVSIVGGEAVVIEGPNVSPQSGGGPGEEQPPKK